MTRAAAGVPRSRDVASSPSDASPAKRRAAAGAHDGYFHQTERPLTSLLFLLPVIVLYEIGTVTFVTDPLHRTEHRIIAFSLFQKFLELCGAGGKYLPSAAVVVILLASHVARGDRWRVRAAHLGGMLIECIVLALPLLVICRVLEIYLPRVPLAGVPLVATTDNVPRLLVLSLGAGVYEELIFRLMAFATLSFVLFDVLNVPRRAGALLIVLIAAVLFSGYHYLGTEPFRWWTFSFRMAAGLYFGAVYLCRGFGITAGSHAAYDICVVSLGALA